MKDEVYVGKVKQYDPEKGYGFIGSSEGDIFFHISDFPSACLFLFHQVLLYLFYLPVLYMYSIR